MKLQQGVFLLLVVMVGCLFFLFPSSPITTTTTVSASSSMPTNETALPIMRCARWVVITSIQPLTDAVEAVARLPSWCVVVVADQKSPASRADYDAHTLSDSLVYLDITTQKHLEYSILPLLPHNSYARKNLGYLYALSQGASVIYETDDDNKLLSDLAPFLSDEEWLAVYPSQEEELPVVNPYAHFGQPSIWPRGYPLTAIGRPDQTALQERRIPSWIQQSLANGDPDVDAIFRLTRKPLDAPLTLTFDELAPPVALPAHTFCPYNSQNTLHHRQAFWALLLPTSVSFRVSDIWRSYWAQRLLWQVGGNLVFLPPTVYQERNAHNYLQDFQEELQLYTDAERFIHFLLHWIPKKSSFPDQIVELSWAMASAGFWGKQDALLSEAWCRDLQQLGYVFPPLHSEVKSGGSLLPTFLPQFRETSMMKHFRVLPPKEPP